MFHNLFKSLFRVTYQEVEDPGAAGAGGEPTQTDPPAAEETTTPGGDAGEPGNEDLPGYNKDEPQGTEEVELFYGDESVAIDIPEDISAELASKGLDAKALANELYRKDGNFSLTPETREKLDGVYGKFAVDAYLNSLKVQNDSFLKNSADQAQAKTKADEDRFTSIASLVGGEEGWDALATWGNENLSAEEIEDLNQVMQSGNESLQKFAIRSLANQRRAAEGDPEAVLIQGQAPETREGGALSAEAYREADIAARKEHRGNPAAYQAAAAKLDARRRAGIAKGL